MFDYLRAPDATDVSVYFRAADTAGLPVTVTSATAGISISYRRQDAAPVAITLSDLALLTDPHADGGLLVVGAGLHRLDVPDAAFAAGSEDVLIFGSATNIVIFGALVQLGVPANSFDANAFTGAALTAIQNEVNSALTVFGAATDAAVAAVLAALTTTTYAVPGQEVPPTNPTLVEAQLYAYKAVVHAVEQTASEFRLMNRTGTVVDQKAAFSDDNVIAERGSLVSGP